MDGQKLWNNILAGVKGQLTASSYKTWFSGSQALDYRKSAESDLLLVAVKNNFIKEQLEKKFSKVIREVLERRGLDKLELSFVVSDTQKARNLLPEPLFTGVVKSHLLTRRDSQALNPNYTFENLVVGESNNLAYAAAVHIIDNLGSSYNPLLFWGPTGVGKSHMLQAIGNMANSRFDNLKVVYVNSERFTNDYIESLRNKTQTAFRGKYRDADILLVDDIQFFSGKDSTQSEFFHTFNELFLSQKQLVMASDRHPKNISRLKDRLLSRFLGGMAVDIGVPDIEMRTAIVKTKCQSQGISLAGEIIDYLAKNCQGGTRELEGLLTSLLARTKLSGNKLSIDDITLLLEQQNNEVRAAVTPQKVIDAVCKYFKVAPALVNGQSRKSELVVARQTLMYLLRKKVGLQLDEIGSLLGGRDHSTVIYGVGKVEKLIYSSQTKADELLRIESLVMVN